MLIKASHLFSFLILTLFPKSSIFFSLTFFPSVYSPTSSLLVIITLYPLLSKAAFVLSDIDKLISFSITPFSLFAPPSIPPCPGSITITLLFSSALTFKKLIFNTKKESIIIDTIFIIFFIKNTSYLNLNYYNPKS